MEEIIEFMKKKHAGQIRKLSKDPYIVHPIKVAEMLKAMNEKDEVLKAAFLHDTIEDTNTTFEEISEKFGVRVANLVKELTSDRVAIKEMGKPQYLTKKMNDMSMEALTIKLADRLDNVSDLNASDLEFARKYLKETQFILNNMKRNLNKNQQRIYMLIKERIETARKELGINEI
jgi:(p)ppGpp synthase/HD superfamily hydrolase